MADQNITELPIKTNTGVANTDYMLGIDASEGYQILVRDVAKYIVENYNGSTLAGSAQTPQSAFNALNSKIALNLTVTSTDTTNVDANIKASADGIYTEVGNVNTSFAGNVFVTSHDAYTVNGSIRSGVTKFTCIRNGGSMYKVIRNSSGVITYNEVAGLNTAYGINAISSAYAIQSNEDLNNYSTPGTFYAQSSTIANSLSHCPVTGYGFKLIVEHLAWTGTILQTIKTAHIPPKYFTRRGQVSSNVWSFNDWVEDPSRAEVDALNSNLTSKHKTISLLANASQAVTLDGNIGIIVAARYDSYQVLLVNYWSASTISLHAVGNARISISKTANSKDITITNLMDGNTSVMILS